LPTSVISLYLSSKLRFCHSCEKNRTATKQKKKKGKMGRIFVVELDGRSYRCKFCRTHLALPEDLASRSFHCRRGKAYLFNNAVNITVGALEDRVMISGMHTVADIFCCCCGQIVGWKYHMRRVKSTKK
ncbi:Yippee family zinc-binding protein, putative isoform 2, partial [Theobroma cacao]